MRETTLTAADLISPAINDSSEVLVGAGEFSRLMLLLPGEVAQPGSLLGQCTYRSERTARDQVCGAELKDSGRVRGKHAKACDGNAEQHQYDAADGGTEPMC